MYDPLDICIGCFMVMDTLILFGINDKLKKIKELLEDDRCQR